MQCNSEPTKCVMYRLKLANKRLFSYVSLKKKYRSLHLLGGYIDLPRKCISFFLRPPSISQIYIFSVVLLHLQFFLRQYLCHLRSVPSSYFLYIATIKSYMMFQQELQKSSLILIPLIPVFCRKIMR